MTRPSSGSTTVGFQTLATPTAVRVSAVTRPWARVAISARAPAASATSWASIPAHAWPRPMRSMWTQAITLNKLINYGRFWSGQLLCQFPTPDPFYFTFLVRSNPHFARVTFTEVPMVGRVALPRGDENRTYQTARAQVETGSPFHPATRPPNTEPTKLNDWWSTSKEKLRNRAVRVQNRAILWALWKSWVSHDI